MRRAIIFALLMVPTGGLVAVLSDTALHRAADVFPEASWFSFVIGCVWGILLAVVCGAEDWILATSRLRFLIVAALAFSAGVLLMDPWPNAVLSLAAGCLAASPAVVGSWLSRDEQGEGGVIERMLPHDQ